MFGLKTKIQALEAELREARTALKQQQDANARDERSALDSEDGTVG